MTAHSDVHTAAQNLGPFDGDKAGYTRILNALLALEWLMLFVSPWFVALTAAHGYAQGLLAALPLSPWKIAFLDLLGLASAASFWTLQKRLGTRIAVGGPEAAFLDQVRYHVASLVLGLLLLMICGIVFAGSHS